MFINNCVKISHILIEGFDMSEINQETMKNVLNSMLSGLKEENVNNASNVADEVKEKYQSVLESPNPPDEHFFAVTYPFKELDEGLLFNAGVKNERTIFLIQEHSFVDNHLSNLFTKYEGMACSADKARTIVAKLYRYLEEGKEITFDYNAQYTYHLPKKILNNHQEIVEYFEALMTLFYGRFEKYLKCLEKFDASNK